MQSYAKKSEFSIPEGAGLKFYQRTFLRKHISFYINASSRVLEIGAGNSSWILDGLEVAEKWVADEYKGVGGGPTSPSDWTRKKIRIEFCSVGLNSGALPSEYFDCVFSCSVLEHIDENSWQSAVDEIYRITKRGGVSIHCIDGNLNKENRDFDMKLRFKDCFLKAGFRFIKNDPDFDMETVLKDPDLYVLSESAYETWWRQKIKNNPSYSEYGGQTSINFGFSK